MKAMVYTHYGTPDVLRLTDVPQPTPKTNEVLIKVYATSVNKADWLALTADTLLVRLAVGGISTPKHPILGADVAGRVEAVGSAVTQFKQGDEVFGDLSNASFGGLAEYVAVPDSAIALKPHNLSFEEAAAVPLAGITALQAVRDKAGVRAGQKVMINGASGGVGSFAVQIAKALGAEVTAVCSTRNIEMVRSLGADQVIDYTQEDFTQRAERYEVIVAVNGDLPLATYARMLRPKGTYVVAGGSMRQIFQGMLLGPLYSLTSGKKFGNVMAKANQKDLIALADLLRVHKVRPVIDRCFPLSEAANAFRYLGEGHARGKVVVTVAHSA
jgi:NADPH:quinone reductase-like Zn-dependent oxidoreductase